MGDVAALLEAPTEHDDRVRLLAAIAVAFTAARARAAVWDLPALPVDLPPRRRWSR